MIADAAEATRSRPRILIVLSCYLPGFRAGGPIRSVEGLVEHLGSEMDVSIVTLDRDLGAEVGYADVRVGVWQSVGAARVMYLHPRSWGYRRLRFLFAESKPQTVYLNSLFSFRFAILPLLVTRRLGARVRTVLAPRGSLSKAALGSKRYKKVPFLLVAGRMKLFRDLTWQASSPLEMTEIRDVFPRADVFVAANLQRRIEPPSLPRTKQRGSLRAVFASRIVPKKNLLYLLTLLAAMDVRLHLDIIGPTEDGDYWTKCSEAMAKLPPTITTSYLGEMAHDDVAIALAGHHLMILPTRNENFGHVILESLCSGTPVLISDQTPWRGLPEAGAGWDVDLELPERFQAAIEACVAWDDAAFRSASAAARALGLAAIAPTEVLDANRELLAGPADKRG